MENINTTFAGMKKKEQCPFCKSENVASIMYGFPMYNQQMQKDMDSGKLILGGCCITDDDPDYQCNDCGKNWKRSDKRIKTKRS